MSNSIEPIQFTGEWHEIAWQSIMHSLEVLVDPKHLVVMGLWLLIFTTALATDMFAHRKHAPTVSNALLWSIIWIVVGLSFSGIIWIEMGRDLAFAYASGYVLEKTLAIDNLFVFFAIFSSFGMMNKENQIAQHKVLHWGILGAIIFRFIFLLFIGILINLPGSAHTIVMGVLTLCVGLMAVVMFKKAFGPKDDHEKDYSNHWSVRIVRKFFTVKADPCNGRMFIRENGKLMVTMSFLALVCIEASDILFAFDSMPAVAAVTRDPVVMFTSTMMAVAGLRALYFFLEAAATKLIHLEKAVAILLAYITVKIGLHVFHLKIPNEVSFCVIVLIISCGVIASFIWPKPLKHSTSYSN